MNNNITMSGGSLVLTRDLEFDDNYDMMGIGTVELASRSIEFGGGDLDLTGTMYIDSSNGFILFRNRA